MGERAVPRLSACAAQARRGLAQHAVADKANASTAIPERLAMLELMGAVVTIDARGGQQASARPLVEAGADSALALQDTHPPRREEVRLGRDTEPARGRLPQQETVEKGEGRIKGRCYALSEQLAGLVPQPEWTGLQAVGRVDSTRLSGDKTSTECRYYLGSCTDLTRCAATGASSMASIGGWMSSAARMTIGLVGITPHKTWLWCGLWRSM